MDDVNFSKVAGFSQQKFTNSNTPPLVFFTFFKIGQMAPNRAKHRIVSNALAIH